ncbi:MAG TPA: hypothetical protein VIB48_11365 [Acidimicrobiia bacterium]
MGVELEEARSSVAALVDDGRVLEPRLARRRQRTGLVLGVLVVIGAGFRLWALGVHRLNFDESFTAMAGRMSFSRMMAYLRAHDSHPPLDYLLHAPLARAGVSELVLRLPSVACSIGALAVFAWWTRRRGIAGIVATALMALSAFQITHGREARMYAELELLGVAIAVLAWTWLRRPRPWHAAALGALVLAGLLTHVSMFLLGFGLVAIPGRRTDTDAWRWRLAIAGAAAGWAVLWGATFWVQAHGGHSGWIPRTSWRGLSGAVAHLVTPDASARVIVVALVVLGGVILVRRDRTLGRVWLCCFAVPVAVGAVAGLFAPVVLDRTFTLVAWAPLLALGFVVDDVARWRRWVGWAMATIGIVVMVPAAAHAVTVTSGPDTVLRRLASDARAGDVVAVFPAWRGPELEWSLGVRHGASFRPVDLGLRNTAAIRLGVERPSGRVWLLDWRPPGATPPTSARCAPTWSWHGSTILCIGDAASLVGRR